MCPICRGDHAALACREWAKALSLVAEEARGSKEEFWSYLVSLGRGGLSSLLHLLRPFRSEVAWGLEIFLSQPGLMAHPPRRPAWIADARGGEPSPLVEAVEALFQGKPLPAIRQLVGRASAIAPADYWPRAWLGLLSLLEGDTADGREQLVASLPYAGSDRRLVANTRRLTARARFCGSDLVAGAAAAQEALNIERRPELHYDLALYLALAGQVEEACRHLEEAVRGCSTYHRLAHGEAAFAATGWQPRRKLEWLEAEAKADAEKAILPLEEALAYGRRLGAESLIPELFLPLAAQAEELKFILGQGDYEQVRAIPGRSQTLLLELSEANQQAGEAAARRDEARQRVQRGALIGFAIGAGAGVVAAVILGSALEAAGNSGPGTNALAAVLFLLLAAGGTAIGALRDWLR